MGKFHERFDKAAKYLALAGGFGIPISTSLSTIAFPLAFIFWALSGDLKRKIHSAFRVRVSFAAYSLLALLFLGLLYSSASTHDSLRVFNKYFEALFYIPVLILIFDDETWRKRGVIAFCAAMVLTLIFSILLSLGLSEFGKGSPGDAAVFAGRITQNIFMSFFLYLAILLFMEGYKKRDLGVQWLAGIVIVLAFVDIIFLVGGRTGYIVLFGLLILAFYEAKGKKGLLVSVALLLVIVPLLYVSSSKFSGRIETAVSDYKKFQAGVTYTSVGERLTFYKNGTKLILEKPFFGHGTGSVQTAYAKYDVHYGTFEKQPSANLHSEYLMLGAQLGIVGLLVYLGLLFSVFRESYQLEPRYGKMARGVAITIFLSSFTIAPLLDHSEGYFFAYMVGLIYSSLVGKVR